MASKVEIQVKEYCETQLGITEETLSLLITHFFPQTPHCYYSNKYYSLHSEGILGDLQGSIPERLDLPFLLCCKSKNIVYTDRDDRIFMPGDITEKCYEIENHWNNRNLQPGYCRVYEKMLIGFGPISSTEVSNQSRSLSEIGVRFKQKSNKSPHVADQEVQGIPKLVEKWKKINPKTVNEALEITNPGLAWIYDKVPCIGTSWPVEIISEMQKRNWPKKKILQKILNKDLYLVCKAHPKSQNPDVEFRYSFSEAEIVLALSLTQTQRTCFRVLKALIKWSMNIKFSKEDILPSYFIKTALFWVCPERSENNDSPAVFMFCLIEKLHLFLERNHLPHFFVPKCNLLDVKHANLVRQWKMHVIQLKLELITEIKNFWLDHGMGQLQLHSWDMIFTTNKFEAEPLKHKILCHYLVNLKYQAAVGMLKDGSFSKLGIERNEAELDKLIHLYQYFLENEPYNVLADNTYSFIMWTDYATLLLQKLYTEPKIEQENNKLDTLQYCTNICLDLYAKFISKHINVHVCMPFRPHILLGLLKFANFYLRKANYVKFHMSQSCDAEQKNLFEEVVKLIIIFLIRSDREQSRLLSFWIVPLVSDTVDPFFKVHLLYDDMRAIKMREYSYFLLLSAYGAANVWAEVYVPNYVESEVFDYIPDYQANSWNYITKTTWAIIYMSQRNYQTALRLIKESFNEMFYKISLSEMLYCVAKWYCDIRNVLMQMNIMK